MLTLGGGLVAVEEVDAHIEAAKEFVDQARDLAFLDLDDVHEPGKEELKHFEENLGAPVSHLRRLALLEQQEGLLTQSILKNLLHRQLLCAYHALEYVDGVSVEPWMTHLVVVSDQGQQERLLFAHLSREQGRVALNYS